MGAGQPVTRGPAQTLSRSSRPGAKRNAPRPSAPFQRTPAAWPSSSLARTFNRESIRGYTRPTRLLASGKMPPAPSHPANAGQWRMQAAEPVTAARPRPICTDFRLLDRLGWRTAPTQDTARRVKERRQIAPEFPSMQTKFTTARVRIFTASRLPGVRSAGRLMKLRQMMPPELPQADSAHRRAGHPAAQSPWWPGAPPRPARSPPRY